MRHGGLGVVVLAVGAALLGLGCDGARETGSVTTRTAEGYSTTPAVEAAEERDLAMVRVVNALPGAEPVSVSAGDRLTIGGVRYRSTSKWYELPDDLFDFKLRRGDPSGAEPIAANREPLVGGGHYTIVAMPGPESGEEATLRVLQDDFEPVPADRARVRFIHAVPAGSDVAVFVVDEGAPLFGDVNHSTAPGWREVAPAVGSVVVRQEDGRRVLARLNDVKLEGGRSYTFILAGRATRPDLFRIEDDVAKNTGTDWEATGGDREPAGRREVVPPQRAGGGNRPGGAR